MSFMPAKTRLLLLVLIFYIAQLGVFIPQTNVVKAADNGLAQKPYMGWSSYSMQVYSNAGSTWISEAQIKAQSDAMHTKLQSHGYNHINVDAAWNGGMDGYGRPVPSTTLYPGGFTNLIDYVHNNGQKFGIYLIPGLSPQAYKDDLPIYGAPGCTMRDIAVQPLTTSDYWNIGYKIDFSNPCAQSYITSIADLIASWGVDFVKFDSVTPGSGHNDTTIDARDDVKAWSQALAPHHIWFELSWALDHKYVDYWKKYANGWRVDWDVESYKPGVSLTEWNNIARLFPDAALWWRDAGPGGWNDFDSLNIGNGAMDGLTPDERQTAMSLWSMSSAQLYTGNDLTNLDSYGIELLTNDEVIAVNQAGHPAHPVSMDTDQQVWYANNGDGSYTVGFYNLGSSSADVNVKWSDIGLSGSATVRDLWSHTDLGTFDSGYSSVNLASHASRLFKVMSKGGANSLNNDDTGIKYTGNWRRSDGRGPAGVTQDLAVTVSDSLAKDSTINPNSGSFDKKITQQADVSTTMTLNGNTLRSIANSGTPLVLDTDYTVAGNVLTIKKEYLANQPVGTTSLTLFFSAGATQTFAVKVSNSTLQNSTVSPAAVSFDQKATAQADVTTTLALNGNVLNSIKHEGTLLTSGTDYTISDTLVTIKKEYLSTLQTGTTNLTFSFSAGAAQTVALIVRDTSVGGSITLNDNDPSIVYSSGWNQSAGRGLGDYMNDVHWTETNDAYFEYTFTGTGIELSTEMDPSQGAMDIYVDNVFKQTVSTYNIGRLAQQTVYNITGLPNGSHTLKAVKKSGFFMLLDKLRISVPDLITPAAGSFDKKPTAQADVTATMTVYGNNLNSISNSGAILVSGTDYTVSSNLVTIKKEYLASQPIGTSNLDFSFNGGASQTLVVTVSDSSSQNSTVSVNDNDPGITYSGTWGHSTGRGLGDYQDDVHYTETNDAYLEYPFTGTGIDFITEKDSSQGDIDIYVDNVFKQTVSTYNGSRLVQQTVYSITGLANGPHTIKAVKKSGSYMLLDKLSIHVPVAISPTSASFDKKKSAQTNVSTTMSLNGNTLSSITNNGTLLMLDTDYTISGSTVSIKKEYLAAQSVGTTNLTFTFSGGGTQTLSITVIDTTQPNSTISPVSGSFDKKSTAQADLRITMSLGDNTLSSIDNGGIPLVSGTDYTRSGNTITIHKGYLAAQSLGTTSLVFSFSSGASQTLVIIISDTSQSASYSINNDDTGISYTGYWQRSTNRGIGDYRNDVQFTEADGAYFEYSFTGTGIEMITEKDVSQGDIDIYVDNVFKQTVSTYNASRLIQQTVYSIAGLPNGSHTLKVVKKSGSYMLLDKLKIIVADLISATTRSFDKATTAQADVNTSLISPGEYLISRISNGENTLVPGTDYTISGSTITIKKEYLAAQQVGTAHLTFSFSGDYQDDVHLTETNNDYFQYSFKGTGIEMISEKDPSLGDIDIYVDNEYKQTVSTYNTSKLVQQTVYSISGLSNRLHTIKAVKKSGAFMLLDKLSFTSSLILTDEEAVTADKAALAIGYTSPDGAAGVTHNITLPITGSNGTSISWSSNRKSVISNSGVVTRPPFKIGDKSVSLTAVIIKGEVSSTKTFTVTVSKLPPTNKEAVEADEEALEIGFTSPDKSSNVTQNLILPLTGSNGTAISWSSNKPSAISNSGIVSRPAYAKEDTKVTLTATISKGNVKETKTFKLTVKKLPNPNHQN